MQQESQRFKRDELKLLSIARLESLERHWNVLRQAARGLASRSRSRPTSQYTEDAAELARRRASWEATAASAETAGLAPALANRVQSVLAQIALAEQAVSGPIDRQIRLARRANAVETAILAGQKAVAAAIAYNDSRLARIDSPPLWEPGTSRRPPSIALQSITVGLEVEKRFLDEYNAANARYLQALNTFVLLLLPLLLWLSRRSRKVVSDDPEIQASTRVLRRPISSWLVLAMLGIVVLEPDAPMLRHQARAAAGADPGAAPAAAGRLRGARPLALRRHRPVPAAAARASCCWRIPTTHRVYLLAHHAADRRAARLGAVAAAAARRQTGAVAHAEDRALRRLGRHRGAAGLRRSRTWSAMSRWPRC